MEKLSIEVKVGRGGIYVHGVWHKATKGIVIMTEDDLINPHAVGIDRLHQRLQLILRESGVAVEQIVSYVANAHLVRIAHLAQVFGLPRYIGIKLFQAFHESGAAIINGSVLRKTADYASALEKYKKTRSTLQPKKVKYQLPPEVGELGASLETMSEEMLYLELAEAEKTGTNQDVTTLLAALKRAKAETRAKQPQRSEVEQFQHALDKISGKNAIDEDAQQPSRRRKK